MSYHSIYPTTFNSKVIYKENFKLQKTYMTLYFSSSVYNINIYITFTQAYSLGGVPGVKEI